jgi:8-oxo-dGTP pyrophosphatase MutT (NUDIX family)
MGRRMVHKSDIQFAALPWRINEGGRSQVMLLTTRETRRWTIPKGWPMKGRKPTEVASQEAYEEAGLVGHIVSKRPLGTFHYEKQLTMESRLCQVRVFSFRVERQLDDWPEKQQRETNGLTQRRLPRWWRKTASTELLPALPVHMSGLLLFVKQDVRRSVIVRCPRARRCESLTRRGTAGGRIRNIVGPCQCRRKVEMSPGAQSRNDTPAADPYRAKRYHKQTLIEGSAALDRLSRPWDRTSDGKAGFIGIGWAELTFSPDEEAVSALATSWAWLLPDTWTPLLFSVLGDVFLEKPSGGVFWLNTGTGEVSRVADDADGFRAALGTEVATDWFMPPLIERLRSSGGSGGGWLFE